MTISDLLNLNASRKNIDQIIEMAAGNPLLTSELWSIFISRKEPEGRRAAWALDLMVESGILNLTEQQIIELVGNLELLTHDGFKRHSLRIISNYRLIPETIGPLANICFSWLESPMESVAVKMYSITILCRISEIETELRRELIDLIEIQMDEATPGFQNIGSKAIAKLRKSM